MSNIHCKNACDTEYSLCDHENDETKNDKVVVTVNVEPSEGNGINLAINGKGVYALVDTGASVCVISENMYKKCGLNRKVLAKSNIDSVIGIGGKITSVLGEVEAPLIISGLNLHQNFVVIPGSCAPEIILGKNFLYAQRCNLDFVDVGKLSLQEGLVTVNLEPPKEEQKRVCFVKTMTDVTVGAESECLFPVKIEKSNSARSSHQNNGHDSDTFGIVQTTMSLPKKYKVTGPKCAVSPSSNNKATFRLLNPYPTDGHIPKGTVVGTYTEANDATTSLVHMSELPQRFAVDTIIPDSRLRHDAPEFIPQSAPANVSCVTADRQHDESESNDKSSFINRILKYTEDTGFKADNYNNADHAQTVNAFTDSIASKDGNIATAVKLGVKIAENLPLEDRNKLLDCIGRNNDVFATSMEELGCYKDYHHVIDTGDAAPVKSRFYRASPEQKLEIERQVKLYMDNGIVERSTSDWLSPVILVTKSDGSFRLVIDYRSLNRLVKPVFFPLPRHEDVIDALGQKNAAIFSTLDLAQAFLQTQLDPKTKHKTAFITHHGVFQFTRTPYGLSNSPASFGIVMSRVLQDFAYVFALVYADDILIYSSDLDEHLRHLQQVFDKLRQANLTLKPTKCVFGAEKVKFLGHIFSSAGVSVDPEKTKAIDTFPEPSTPTQVRSFLGVCQYYRKFVKDFAEICAPLNALLRKDAKFVWDSKCREAFQTLKSKLTSSPILAFPVFNDREFILYTDASGSSISYILGQKNDKGKEVVISYGGRALRDSERRWGITELEGLALIEGIRHYHVYLTDRPFTAVTDHAALQYIKQNKMTTGRLSRWAIFLQQYRINIIYKKGKLHSNADSLSRREYPPTTSKPSTWISAAQVNTLAMITNPDEAKKEAESRYVQLNSLQHLVNVLNTSSSSVKDQQRSDPELLKIVKYIEDQKLPQGISEEEERRFIADSHDYVVDDDGLLYHLYTPRGKGLRADRLVKQLVVPASLKHDVLLSYHDSLLAGHQGFDRTYHLIRLKYFWLRMYNEIKQYVKSCLQCQQNKKDKHSQHKAPLQPIPCEGIFKRIHVDLFGPLPEVKGFKFILLVVDSFSKWPEAFAVRTLQGKEIAQILYRDIICRWGAPYSLVSDRGTNFLSKIVTEVCKLFKVAKYKTTSWHPQCNATAERRMSSLAQSLRMFTNKQQNNWPDLLPSVMAAWRATPCVNSTLFSPYKILLGQEMRLPIDTTLLPKDDTPPDVYRHLEDLVEDFEVIHDMAKQNIQRAQEEQKKYHDRKAVKPSFQLEDMVWLENKNKTVGLCPKLQPKYLGPYYITDVNENNTYELRDCQTHKPIKSRVNADRLKKYTPTTVRDISLNDIADDNEGDGSSDANDTQPQPTDTPQSTAPKSSTSDPIPGPSHDSHDNGDPPSSQDTTDNDPPYSQPEEKKVESITKCSYDRGQKWYLVKWSGQKFKVWTRADLVPESAIRHFHVTRTQKGKVRKALKKNKKKA